jgi:hypothetical protein
VEEEDTMKDEMTVEQWLAIRKAAALKFIRSP